MLLCCVCVCLCVVAGSGSRWWQGTGVNGTQANVLCVSHWELTSNYRGVSGLGAGLGMHLCGGPAGGVKLYLGFAAPIRFRGSSA